MRTDRVAVAPPGRTLAGTGAGRRWVRAWAPALGAAGFGLALVTAMYAFPYATGDIRYPLGWDSAVYTGWINIVYHEGVDAFGTIRVGTPLLFSALVSATGQNMYTLVALVPPVLAGVAGLGAAGLVRAALGIRPVWVPVIGVLTWAAFGENGIMNIHLDNLINVALVLAAFAAAVTVVGAGQGILAASILFAGAGLVHWPFYLVAMVIYLLALAPFVASAVLGSPRGFSGAPVWPLLGAAGVSGAFVGITFFSQPESGWVGVRLKATQLAERFFLRLRDPERYYAVPLAAGGFLVALRSTGAEAPPTRLARRLFLALMGSWVLVTIIGGIAQVAGYPTAGARLLHFFFAIPVMAAVLVWWLARWLAARLRGALGVTAAVLVVAVVVGVLGGVTVANRSNDRSWIDAGAVKQITAAVPYIERLPREEVVVFVMARNFRGRPSWAVVKSTIPGSDVLRSAPYFGSPEEYLAGVPSGRLGHLLAGPPELAPEGGPEDHVAIVIERFNHAGFTGAAGEHPERVIAPGVYLLNGPLPTAPLPERAAPAISGGLRRVVLVTLLVSALLFMVGGGWSIVLLPTDPVLRATLAPALGVGVLVLVTFAWGLVGLPVGGPPVLFPLVISALGGWLLAVLRLRRGAGQSQGVTEITS
jgi:hypothetical protein